MKRIVLAYSGGSAASAALASLAQHHGAEIVTLTLDFGQERELAAVRERALALGAVRAHVIDAREEFVRDFVLPSLQAGALESGGHPLVGELPGPLIARRLVQVARMESASAVAHGGVPGTTGEHALHQAIRSLAPDLDVIAPARQRAEPEGGEEAFVPAAKIADAYRTDASLWGRILTPADGGVVPEEAFSLTRAAEDCQDDGAVVDIDFAAGVPVRANGVEMSIIEMIESLETIAGAHGVGRMPAGGRVIEAPAAVVLQVAHRELESLIVGADLAALKAELARLYAETIVSGRWFSDLREAIDAFVGVVQTRVTGSVRVTLARGRCDVTRRTSPHAVPASGSSSSPPPLSSSSTPKALA